MSRLDFNNFKWSLEKTTERITTEFRSFYSCGLCFNEYTENVFSPFHFHTSSLSFFHKWFMRILVVIVTLLYLMLPREATEIIAFNNFFDPFHQVNTMREVAFLVSEVLIFI